MASFDENGKYIKTNWKSGDKISSTKLNKIEESIEAVNDNDISRHVEADARLDALEAKDVAHDKELTKIKNDIADNKAAAELGDYDINSRMTFLEEELNEGIEEVHNVAETVDGKIAKAESDMTNTINTAKSDMTAQVNDAKSDITFQVDSAIINIDTAQANMTNQVNIAKNEITTQVNTAKYEITSQVDRAMTEMNTQVNNAKSSMTSQVITARNEMTTQVDTAQANMTDQVNLAKSEVTSQVNSAMNSMNTAQTNMQAMVEHVETEIFTFENRIEDEWDGLHENVANYVDIESNSFTLGIHEDGLLYIFKDGSPKGVGIEMLSQEVIAGDVIGFIDDDNNIVLSGALAEGIYALKYEMNDGTIINVGEIKNITGPTYTNRLPLSINSDGTPFNGGQGWKTGFRMSLSSGGESSADGCECTGFIPVPNYEAVIRLKNVGTYDTDGGEAGHYGIVGYDKDFNKLPNSGVQLSTMQNDVSADGVVTLKTLGWATHFANTNLAYVRISSRRITADSIITVNELIV